MAAPAVRPALRRRPLACACAALLEEPIRPRRLGGPSATASLAPGARLPCASACGACLSCSVVSPPGPHVGAATRPGAALAPRLAARRRTRRGFAILALRAQPAGRPRSQARRLGARPAPRARRHRRGRAHTPAATPVASSAGCRSSPEPHVGAQRPRVARGEDREAARVRAVPPGAREQLPADAARLRPRRDHETATGPTGARARRRAPHP